MRNLIIVAVLTALLFSGSIVSDIYIKNSVDQMLDAVENISTKEDVEEITERWVELSAIAELVIDHSEIDLLNQHLWAMETEIDSDTEEFEKSKKLATEMFLHIRSRNTLAWNNVF